MTKHKHVLHDNEVDWDGIPYKVEVNAFAGYWGAGEIGPPERGYDPQRGSDPNITELKITVTEQWEDLSWHPVSKEIHDQIHWKIWDDPHTWMDWI